MIGDVKEGRSVEVPKILLNFPFLAGAGSSQSLSEFDSLVSMVDSISDITCFTGSSSIPCDCLNRGSTKEHLSRRIFIIGL